MKYLITTIAALVLVGCGESQQSATPSEAKPEPTTANAPDISIHEAARDGNIEAVKQHLAAGTDVNIKTDRGLTPLHYANNKETIELLLAKGADVNAKIDDGRTPLHFAAMEGHKEIAELLIAKGANVNAKDDFRLTPLDAAIMKGGAVDLLRKNGAKTAEELKAEGK